MRNRHIFDQDLSYHVLDQLLKWRQETAPEQGDAGADEKNYKAGQALYFAGLLFEDLVRWAIHHKIGVSTIRLSLEDRKAGEADAHRFEEIGSEWQVGDLSQARELLADIIAVSGLVPGSMRQTLVGALQALNLGEVDPLMEPTHGEYWTGAHSLAELRKLVIMQVFFRWGRRTHIKRKAQEEVAGSLGVGVNTLRTWEERWLPSIDPDVKSIFEIAKRAGGIQCEIDDNPGFQTDDKVALMMIGILLELHPLQHIAEEHRRAVRQARA